MRGLKDKVVIITGGAGGIGTALSARFAAEGSKVAIFDLNAASADAVVDGIKTNGGTAIGCAVDITDHDAVNEAVARIEATLGPVDVLVNNAGWDHADRFVNTTPALWQKLISINLVGPLNLHHAVLKGMLERGHGRIVNIASDAGRVGSSGESVYSACKGGSIACTKTIARETARKKINVIVVCPGPTYTALFKYFAGEGESGDKLRGALEKAIPFGRLGQPEDVVGAVCFMASDDAE
ncbi:MAG: SDR family NAD(P)-dependent oxidoreductase, partial [Sphingomonadales bacterium]|nr:SDR family NAD(P)-dependent oxidoreductase [Sphingomonadales bacterium]